MKKLFIISCLYLALTGCFSEPSNDSMKYAVVVNMGADNVYYEPTEINFTYGHRYILKVDDVQICVPVNRTIIEEVPANRSALFLQNERKTVE